QQFTGSHGGHPAPSLLLVAKTSYRARHHVMYRKTNRRRHFTFRQFFIDQGSSKATERTASIFFRRDHAHQTEFSHLTVDLAGKVVIFVPFLSMWGNFLLREATDRVANI